MAATTMTLSTFLRNSGDALAVLDDHDVLLERRDGEDIYLKRADRERAEHDMLVTAGRMMESILRRNQTRAELSELMASVAPWSGFLPERSRAEFVDQFVRTIAACADLDDFAPAAALLRQWKNTADVYANPALLKRLQAEIEPGEAVARPAGGG